jgi:FG-GAP-like repeat/FG-GAP repeat
LEERHHQGCYLRLAGFAIPTLAQNNPIPLVNQPLVPDAVTMGGHGFTLTVNGTGFVAKSVINWNGGARTTTFVSASQVTALISAADIATPGTTSVTVVNPAPGGGVSNVVFLPIPTTSFKMILASSPAVGISPFSVFAGDFNGDGKLDLAVTNEGSNTVSILLGDGTGSFTLASSPSTGRLPLGVAAGDFNADGKPDLAVSNYCGSANCIVDSVSILLGDGTGNFTLASSPATGIQGYSIAVGDFNGDGKLDLAVTNYGSNTVSILLGDGTGNFTPISSPATGTNPYSVAVGDFNGDGKLDLAVANFGSNTISILRGDGTGHFTLALSPATGANPESVAVGDFNGDGKLDLAVANFGSSTISILLGDGAGSFSLASSPATRGAPKSVATGDFNGDGKLDLAIVGGNTVSVLQGDGTGNFTLVSSPSTGGGPDSVAVGDFNGDGKLDLAVANSCGNSQNCTAAGTVSILVQAPVVNALTK